MIGLDMNPGLLGGFHSQYRELHSEPLARPFPVVSGQVMVSHRAILFTPSEAAAHRAAVAALAAAFGAEASREEHGFQVLHLEGVDLRIERHTEFTTFMAIAPQTGVPFAESAADRLPPVWSEGIPGRLLAAVEIATEGVAGDDAGAAPTMERISKHFDQERFVGGWTVERVASVWSTFKLDERGATRFLVHNHGLTPGRYGRLLQRLVEIETYRMAALLALPLARDLLPQVEALEAQHVALVERMGNTDSGDERVLLSDLTNLSLTTERLRASCGTRFSLTGSYERILSARVGELREEQVAGYQTIGEFFDRRLSRAWHTCQRADAELTALTARLRSTTGLLRTRVEVNLQTQNQQILASMDQRAAAQLRLQHNVEGLSVVVVTYDLATLAKVLLEGTEAAGFAVHVPLVEALALPVLAFCVWAAVRRARN